MSSDRVGYTKPTARTVDGVPDEIFVFANDEKDARRIDEMNGCGEARLLKKARMQAVAERGVVHEVNMPGTLESIRECIEEERRRCHYTENRDFDVVEGNPRNLLANVDRVEILASNEGTLRTTGHIKIDGEEIRGVKRVTIDVEAGKLPKVTLELWSTKPDEVTL